MSSRQVWHVHRGTRYPAGWITRYVGATARTMGSDPVYAAHVAIANGPSAAFPTWSQARDWVIWVHTRKLEERSA